MSLQIFQRQICAVARHCATCRDIEQPWWRRSTERGFGLAEGELEVCPSGHPWGHGRQVLAVRAATEIEALIAAHCVGCPNEVLGPNEMPGCSLVMNCQGRPCFERFREGLAAGNGCPTGKFSPSVRSLAEGQGAVNKEADRG